MTERSQKRRLASRGTQAEAERIINDANAEAERIRNDANARAESLLDDARDEARMYKNHATTAAKDILDEAKENAEQIVQEAQKTADMIMNQVRQAKRELTDIKQQLTCYRAGYKSLQATELNQLRDEHVEALKKIRETEFMLCAKARLCELKPDMKCPISGDIMRDPVVAADNFSYDRNEINQWITQRGYSAISPSTGAPFADFEVRTNMTLKKIINDELDTLVAKERIRHRHTDLLTNLIVSRLPSTASSIAYDNVPLQD